MAETLQRPVRAVVFDGDDTLWDTQVLYEAAKGALFDILGRLGYTRPDVATKLAEIDIGNVEKLGLSRHRFPMSLRQTYEFFCHAAGHIPGRGIADQVEEFGRAVFDQSPAVRRDAEDVLTLLKPEYRLVLFTAGDQDVQWSRLHHSGLRRFFDGVHVTPEKNQDTWTSMLASEALQPSSTWSVGNSVRSDVNPALALGLRCILIAGGTWEFERAAVLAGNVGRAASLSEAVGQICRNDGLAGPVELGSARAGRGGRA